MVVESTQKRLIALASLLILLSSNTLAANTSSVEPIIIKTVAQHYENPTLEQYTQCTRNRDSCINNCSHFDKTCQDKCQICPILIDQDILVQGINDTLYRLPITHSKVNQTNIIRLTNEIRNIIRTSLGNITAHNTNNITVYQRVSKTGGKFGLGYTEKGPCCHLIEPQRCRRTLNGPPVCTHLRQQMTTCGSHCISRVMRAKRIVTCSETDPDNCTKSVEYLPQPKRPGCVYTSKWPFINCKISSRRRTHCDQCYQIPYLQIVRGQMPRACLHCFVRSSAPQRASSPYQQGRFAGYGLNQPIISYPSYSPYQPFQPYSFIQPRIMPMPVPIPSDSNLYDESYELGENTLNSDSDFKLEVQKCINEDGTVVENCTEEESPLRVNVGTETRDGNGDEDFSTDGSDFDFEEEEEEVSSGLVYRRRRQNS